jgi:hypothetical protein
MTKKDLPPLGSGGSTTVTESGTVEHTGGTLNPGEPGYSEARARAELEDKKNRGALNRAPSREDLVAADEPKAAERPAQRPASTNATQKTEK